MPVTPHNAAGCLIDPPVSLPKEHDTNPAETAAAGPPLDPPGTLVKSHGFLTSPKYYVSFDEPIANSSKFPFPITIPPLCMIFFVTKES